MSSRISTVWIVPRFQPSLWRSQSLNEAVEEESQFIAFGADKSFELGHQDRIGPDSSGLLQDVQMLIHLALPAFLGPTRLTLGINVSTYARDIGLGLEYSVVAHGG